MTSFDTLPCHLLRLLQQHPQGLSEYKLIGMLREQGLHPFADADLRTPLSLFRTHFVLFHALYLLNDRLAGHNLQLQINPLSIRMLPRSPGQAGLSQQDPLREYYLDLQQLADTGSEQVEAMLSGSLVRMQQQDEVLQALACLGFTAGGKPDSKVIKRQYRRLARQHHPDLGGCTQRLQQLNRAQEILKRHGLLDR